MMVKKISFESLLNIYREYNISSGGKLAKKEDQIFLKVSKKLKVKKKTIYASLQNNWSQILKSQPMVELVDCCRPNNVIYLNAYLITMVKTKHLRVSVPDFISILDIYWINAFWIIAIYVGCILFFALIY